MKINQFTKAGKGRSVWFAERAETGMPWQENEVSVSWSWLVNTQRCPEHRAEWSRKKIFQRFYISATPLSRTPHKQGPKLCSSVF